jgi:hypothetical protein
MLCFNTFNEAIFAKTVMPGQSLRAKAGAGFFQHRFLSLACDADSAGIGNGRYIGKINKGVYLSAD